MLGEIFGEQGLIVLALILVFMFGGSKLPELARSLGRAKKEFQEGITDSDDAAATGPASPTSAPPAIVPPSAVEATRDPES